MILAAALCACASATPREGKSEGTAAPGTAIDPSAGPAPALKLGLDEDAEILPIGAPLPVDSPLLPTDRASLLVEAHKLSQSGRFEEALSILDTLLVLEPSSDELLERRAAVFLAAERRDEAAEDLKRCCALGRPSCCAK
jgi:tetratricopeptide (TPR) repeat protein